METWATSDGMPKNEIDLIITSNKHLVVNNILVGSDHRLVRTKIILNVEKERSKTIKGKKQMKWNLVENTKTYEKVMHNSLETSKIVEMDVDSNRNCGETMSTYSRKEREEKISIDTKRFKS